MISWWFLGTKSRFLQCCRNRINMASHGLEFIRHVFSVCTNYSFRFVIVKQYHFTHWTYHIVHHLNCITRNHSISITHCTCLISLIIIIHHLWKNSSLIVSINHCSSIFVVLGMCSGSILWIKYPSLFTCPCVGWIKEICCNIKYLIGNGLELFIEHSIRKIRWFLSINRIVSIDDTYGWF